MGELSRAAHPEYLFGDINKTHYKKLAHDHKIALFMDFDGTLVPIRENPAECFLSEKIKQQLRSLADSEHVCLTIMSGRSLADVRKRVGIRKIYYGGNHGFDISGPGLKYTHEKALSSEPLMRHVKRRLKHEIEGIQGAWIEDKKFTVSLHFRSVKKQYLPSVKKVFYKVAREYLQNRSLGVIKGKKVLELTPRLTWDKGRAVRWILHLLNNGWLPIYVGDDTTDETAFAALKKGGITIRVGKSKSTRAKYYVKGYWEIPQLLEIIKSYAKWRN